MDKDSALNINPSFADAFAVFPWSTQFDIHNTQPQLAFEAGFNDLKFINANFHEKKEFYSFSRNKNYWNFV